MKKFLLVLPAALAAAGALAQGARPALFKDSRQSLAIARAQGRKHVSLLIATRPGEAAAVAAKAARLDGDIRYRDDEVGYLRVRISIDRATELAEFAGIEAVALDYDDRYPNRLGPSGRVLAGDALLPAVAQTAGSGAPEWPPRLTDYPLQNPYSPVRDLGAADFLARHPTWDGRGVTIAVLDGNFDVLLPEFQTAYSLDGKPVPKVADYLNVTDPRDDFDLNPQWVDMKTKVSSRRGRVVFGGKTFTVPRNGTYRIGFFSERRFNDESNAAYIDQDIDRDGNPKGDDGLFGVLWNEKSNDVWVDTNRNLDFTDEKAMTDYVRRPEFGVFGKDDPSTPYRDTIAFAVQTDEKNKYVSINVGIYQHCTTILGAVVGNREPKGRILGVAPGARIVSVFYGVSNAHGLIEGLITAFRHPQVDLVVLEQSVAIASIPYLLADGTHPISVIAQRLIDRYQKLLFVPGDNSPAFGFVAEDGLAPGAMSVGGYQNKESYRINNGFVPENDDNLHWGALSHGPSGAGALKPDLLAPSGQMGTEVGYRKGAGQKGLYTLPPGYSVDGGTSTATPMAAGATALVVSAAKQSGVPFDAVRLKAALTGSARHIDNLAAHEQGNGLIQVGPAYELLKRLQAQPPIVITSRAPVRTKLSGLLRTPGEGVGIYEREGWKSEDTGERTITLTRLSGPAEPMTFALTWVGNDGTFESPGSVTLPRNAPVAVPVRITAKGEGAHTAILSVDHPDLPGHAHRVLNSIVVAYPLREEDGYAAKAELTPPLPGDRGFFVDVPPGVAALAFTASSPKFFPTAIGPDRDPQYVCPFDPHFEKPPVCAIANPQSGVWEINVNNGYAARNFDPEAPVPLKAVPVTISATAVGFDVTASASGALDSGRARPVSISLQNRLGKVTAGAAAVDLASASRRHARIAQGEQQLYEVTVPKGTTSLFARVSNVSRPEADLDVYLLDCTSPEKLPEAPSEQEKGNRSPMRPPPLCTPVAKAADVGPGGQVEITDPKPGRWVVAVDAFSVPGGAVEYDYLDLYTNPRFGALSVAELEEERASSTRWTVAGSAWAASPPDSSRELAARVVAKAKDATRGTGAFGSGDRVPIAVGEAEIWFSGGPAGAAGSW